MDKVKSLQMALIQKDGVISLLKIQIEQFEEQEVGFREGRDGWVEGCGKCVGMAHWENMWENIREIEWGCCPKKGFGRWRSIVGMYAVMILCNVSFRHL